MTTGGIFAAAVDDQPRAGSGSGRLLVQAWLASRGLILLVALGVAVTHGQDLARVVSQWDVEHFSDVARFGYLARADGTEMAFFPGLPLLLRSGLALGVPIAVTGVVLGLAGSAAAAAALARLGGPWAAVAWLFAPTAVFTVVPYTESLFCAAAFWAWERGRAGRWGAAALLAAAACTLRVSGLFLVGALFVMIITAADRSWPTVLRRAAWLLVPAAVMVAFAAYLYALTGSWTAWFTAQTTGWQRELTWPWESFRNTVAAAGADYFPQHPLWPPVFAAEIVAMAVGLVVVGWCLGRRLWAEAAWVGIQLVAFSISYWFFSVNRAVLLWFPLWMMIAQLGGWRPRPALGRRVWRAAMVLASAVGVAVMLAWAWLYFTGNWAS